MGGMGSEWEARDEALGAEESPPSRHLLPGNYREKGKKERELSNTHDAVCVRVHSSIKDSEREGSWEPHYLVQLKKK